MAYICEKKEGCMYCKHYRFDEDKGRMACFAQFDLKNQEKQPKFRTNNKKD